MSVKQPKLLAGGNPQIPKGHGDEPVQAWIAAVPDAWKRARARRIDELVGQTVPEACKAVKWNSPLYGVQKDAWFLSMHVYTRYLKVAFFRGALLQPPPPGASKTPNTRYLDIHEDDAFDEAQFTTWLKQASQLPGERM